LFENLSFCRWLDIVCGGGAWMSGGICSLGACRLS
jgi:hypothetical protein